MRLPYPSGSLPNQCSRAPIVAAPCSKDGSSPQEYNGRHRFLSFFFLWLLFAVGGLQAAIIPVLVANGTSNNGRAPQGSRLFVNTVYLITPTEMTNSLFGADLVTSVGWEWAPVGASFQNAQTTGTLRVYIQNTTNTTYSKGTNFTNALAGMTKIIDGTITIPAGATPFTVDVPIGGPTTSSFSTVAGQGVYIAFEYNTTSAIATPVGSPTVSCDASLAASLGTAQSQVSYPTTMGLSAFRPRTRLGNSQIDIASVMDVYTLASTPIPFGNPQPLAARVANLDSADHTFNVLFEVREKATNTLRFSTTVPQLVLANTNAVVTAIGWSPTLLELDTVIVTIPAQPTELLLGNNTKGYRHNVTLNKYAYADLPAASGGIGFGTNAGIILDAYNNSGCTRVDAVEVYIASNVNNPIVGNTVYAVVVDITGAIVATSASLVIGAGDVNSYHTFPIVGAPTFTNTAWAVGLAQTANATAYFPVGTQVEASPTRPNTYYVGPLGGGALTNYTTLGRWMLNAVVTQLPTQPVAGGNTNICQNGSTSLTATGGLSASGVYTWYTGSCGGTLAGTGTPLSVSPPVGSTTYYVRVEDVCNGVNSTCGSITVNVTANNNWYLDSDGDGAGDPNTLLVTCAPPLNYVLTSNDLCPNDPLKTSPGICGCGTPDTDSDGDGTANCLDGCPNDPNKIAPGQCGCGVPDTDSDSDGTANCNDGCPNDPNKVAPGTCGCGNLEPVSACNDNNVCTINDVVGANCACAGTFLDSDGDGTCNANDGCPNDPNKIAPGICGCGTKEPGSACNDNNVCTINDVIGTNCICAGTFQDTDGDGTCNANDGCPNDPNKIAPGQCGCGSPDTDTDGDGLANCVDPCPLIAGAIPGQACDDGNPNTIADVWTVNCTCVGQLYDCLGVLGGPALPGTACNDNNVCTVNDMYNFACVCTGTVLDSDGDGTPNCTDGCPNDPSKIAPGQCGCGVPDTDSDGDGLANCVDPCPNGPNPGAPCNDNFNCTVNDVINANCACAGTFLDSDGDGTCNAVDGCPNDPNKIAPGTCGCGHPEPGTVCNDNNVCTLNDVITGACVCAGTYTDSDGDGTCNANDGCPNDPNKIAPGICGCGVADTDSDGDGVANCNDNCPNVPGVVGTPCNDNNINTFNDALNANCICAGTPTACNDVSLTLNLDGQTPTNHTSWDIVTSGTTAPSICSGTGYASNSTVVVTCCLVTGCYDLRVFDSFGDGMTTGGYVLRDVNNNRIIDNAGNGAGFTTLSEVRNTSNVPLSFCLPTGPDALVSGCDQENLLLTSVIQVSADPAVTAQYGTTAMTSGYQYWIFNPNGGYTRRLFQSHSAPGSGYPPATPANLRASYFKLSAMSSAPAIPQFTLLNIRVRSRVAGVDGLFGPACRIKIDPLAACAATQLTITATPIISCGAVGLNLALGVLWSDQVGAANKYQFEFVNANTNVLLRKIASPTRNLNMSTWGSTVALPTCNVPYNVRVRASFDGGTNYCPFGPVCQVTFSCGPTDSREAMLAPQGNEGLQLWPNPNRGDQLNVRIEDLGFKTGTATIDVIDLFGKHVLVQTINVDGSALNYVMDLSSDIADGLYVVNVTTADKTFTRRLVITR